MNDEKYLIYKLKHKTIDAQIPERLGGFNLHGFVNNVERDVINNKISLTVNNHVYIFKEPKVIRDDKQKIIFTYGDAEAHQLEDVELFNQIRNGNYLDDVLRNSETDDVYCVSFNILSSESPIIEKPRRKRARKHVKAKRRTGRKKGRRAR